MTSLIERLFPVPDYRRTPLSLLRWWESRRWLYNKAVGCAGAITLTGMFVIHPERAHMFTPETAAVVLIYAVMANACYSLGWMTEMLAHLTWGRRAPDMGPLLFREGLIFSVGLTLFPLGLTVLFALGQLLFGLLT